MNRRRISIALIAATPAIARSADLPGSDASTSTSTSANHTVEVEDEESTEPGSQFMGPRALGSSIASGNGTDDLNLDDYPEWMHSSIAPSRDIEMFFVILNAILAVGGALTQAVVVLSPIITINA